MKRILALAIIMCFSVNFMFPSTAVAADDHTSYCHEEHESDSAESNSNESGHCHKHCVTCILIKNIQTLKLISKVVSTCGDISPVNTTKDAIGDNSGFSLIGLHTLTGLKIKLNN